MLDLARPDRWGPVSIRRVLRAVGWPSGHLVAIDIAHGVLQIRTCAGAPHRVGDRGELALPSGAPAMCGIARANVREARAANTR